MESYVEKVSLEHKEQINKISKKIDEIESIRSSPKRKISMILYWISSISGAIIVFLLSDFINETIGIFFLLIILSAFFILYAIYFPLIVIHIIRLFPEREYKSEDLKIPLSNSKIDFLLYKINKFVNKECLKNTHFSREEINLFSYSNILSIFSGISVYVIFVLEFVRIYKFLIVIYLVTLLCISIVIVNNRLNS